MKGLLVKLVRSEDGQDLIEYGLLVGIITIGAIVAINVHWSEGEGVFRHPQHRLCHSGGRIAVGLQPLRKRRGGEAAFR